MRRDGPGELHLRALIPLLAGLALVAGCQRDVGISEIADTGFLAPDVTPDVTTDVGGSDAATSGCSVIALDACPVARQCCATPEQRCVPSASGVGICVTSGVRGEGETCGTSGTDDCAFGLLCASATSGRPRLVCRRICSDSTLDCGGSACVVEVEAAGEQIRLCE